MLLKLQQEVGPSFLFMIRFVGYPTNYGTLFGMRNEDVSLDSKEFS